MLFVSPARLPYTYGRCLSANASAIVIEFDTQIYPFNATASPWLLRALAVLEYDPATKRPSPGGVDIYATSDPIALEHGPGEGRITLICKTPYCGGNPGCEIIFGV